MTFQPPVPVGQFFRTATVNGIEQIVSPSQNLGGLVIRTFGASLFADGASLTLYADAVAPSTISDVTTRQIFVSNGVTGIVVNAIPPYPLYVYPGMGLWIGTTANVGYSITYDLLNSFQIAES